MLTLVAMDSSRITDLTVTGSPPVVYRTEGMVPIHPPAAVAAYEAVIQAAAAANELPSFVVAREAAHAAVVVTPIVPTEDRARIDVGLVAPVVSEAVSAAVATGGRSSVDGGTTRAAGGEVYGVGPLPAAVAVRYVPCDRCLRASVYNPDVVCLPGEVGCVRCSSNFQSCVYSLRSGLFEQARVIAVGSHSLLCRPDVASSANLLLARSSSCSCRFWRYWCFALSGSASCCKYRRGRPSCSSRS